MDDDADDHEYDADEEDELADAVASPVRRLPPGLIVLGSILFGCAALPLTPGGASFFALLFAEIVRDPFTGMGIALGYGAPFWFGLIVAIGAWPKSPLSSDRLRRLLVSNTGLLHATAGLSGWMFWRADIGVMPFALFGFAVVSGGFFIVHHASERAAEGSVDDQGRRHPGLSPLWLIRWTATVVVGLCGWMRLQMLGDLTFGWAVEAVLASCVAIAVLLSRRSNRA